MRKTSKFLLLLASLGMLAACTPASGGGSGGDTPGGDTPGGDTPAVVENNINVIYFKSYVSQARAKEIKDGFIALLADENVAYDATKINFFESKNSKVAGFVDEIIDYNEENPSNQVDVILGANGFDNADEPNKTAFLAKYERDENDYTYGTHSNESYNNNRKFWYEKTKKEDIFVTHLQSYLIENYMDGGVTPGPVETGKLAVATYGSFVNEEKCTEIQTGWATYKTEKQITIADETFLDDTGSTSVAEFMATVAANDADPGSSQIDVLLGLATPKDFSTTYPGWHNDGVKYNYGTTEGKTDDRRFWYRELTEEVKAFQAYLQEKYVPVTDEYYLMNSATEWTTDVEKLADYKMTKVNDNQYKFEGLEVSETGLQFKVYHPQGADDATKYYSNASTWENCNFTLSDPDKNIVLAEGKYNINFFITAENDNHVTVEKQSEGGDTTFKVAFFNNYISDTTIAALKTGISGALGDEVVEYQELKGVTKVADAFGLVTSGTQVLLGFRGDSNDVMTNAGYATYDDTEYIYGLETQSARKLWVLESAKDSTEVTAVYNYLKANWVPVNLDLYLTGSMNSWSTDVTALTDYKLSKVNENQYKFDGLVVGESGAEFKVYYPEGATDAEKYLSNDSTWEDCGFTLSNPDKNIVLAEGEYNITFYVKGDNNNHITVNKVESNSYLIAFYGRYISETNIAALEAGIQAAFEAANIEKTIVFQTVAAGAKDTIATAVSQLTKGTHALLGFNGDSNEKDLAGAKYVRVSETSYSYGTDAKRKLWCYEGLTDTLEITTIANYLATNWAVA